MVCESVVEFEIQKSSRLNLTIEKGNLGKSPISIEWKLVFERSDENN